MQIFFSLFSFFFLRYRMTLGLGNVSAQSAFVSAAAAWKRQTSHGLKYTLAHTKLRIYLLLPRGKSPLRSFQLELGFAAILSGLGKWTGDQFTSLARHHRSLAGTQVWGAKEKGQEWGSEWDWEGHHLLSPKWPSDCCSRKGGRDTWYPQWLDKGDD